MTSQLRRFTELLLQSGLVSRDEIERIRSQLSDEQLDDSSTDDLLLQQLVDSGQLTDFQVAAIRDGKSDELILDDYLIIDEIGEGGMGRVYKARHALMRREVAVKFTRAEKNSRHSEQRFRREVEGLSKLVHPNIVSALDAGYCDKQYYLVMEYVEGLDLWSHIHKHGVMTFSEALSVIVQAAEGLKYVHRQGVIHRDVKPGNLVLTNDGTLKVLDVGLAKYQSLSQDDPDENTVDELTSRRSIVGTVDYMAPEQAMNSSDVSPSVDVYALGCTLHYLVTGKPPFRRSGQSVLERVVAHREMEIPALSQVAKDIPKRFDPIFAKMMAKDPKQRYATAGELLVDLKRMQRDYSEMFSIGTTVVDQWNDSPKSFARRYGPFASGILLLLAAGGFWVWQSQLNERRGEGAESEVAASIGSSPEQQSITQPALPVDLVSFIDPSLNALSGDGWEFRDGRLTIPDGSPSKLLVPVATPTDYRLSASIRRMDGSGPFVMLLPFRGETQFFVLVDSQRNQTPASGFGFNSSGRLAVSVSGGRLGTDAASQLQVDVRETGLELSIDGESIVRFDDDPSALKIAAGWSATEKPAIVLGSNHGGVFELAGLRLEPL